MRFTKTQCLTVSKRRKIQHMVYLTMEFHLAKLGICNITSLVIYFLLYFTVNNANSSFYPIHVKYSEILRAQWKN